MTTQETERYLQVLQKQIQDISLSVFALNHEVGILLEEVKEDE